MSLDILNPEFKKGTSNPETFETGEFCRVKDFLTQSNADGQNGGTRNVVTAIVTSMAIRWLSLVASFCYRSGQSFIMSKKIVNVYNVDFLHTFYRR